jgi:hypothetical protein
MFNLVCCGTEEGLKTWFMTPIVFIILIFLRVCPEAEVALLPLDLLLFGQQPNGKTYLAFKFYRNVLSTGWLKHFASLLTNHMVAPYWLASWSSVH